MDISVQKQGKQDGMGTKIKIIHYIEGCIPIYYGVMPYFPTVFLIKFILRMWQKKKSRLFSLWAIKRSIKIATAY